MKEVAKNYDPVHNCKQVKKQAKLDSFSTAQYMKFSIKDFFGKFDQIHIFLLIWSHLLKEYLMEGFIFCAV